MLQVSEIENLAFEGGGVKGIAYAGALEVLEEKEILQSVKRVAGTSAGAITACMLSLGYHTDKIKEIVSSMDLSSFTDWQFIWNRFKYYGKHPGKKFVTWIKEQIKASPLGLKETSTFADLKEKGGRDLHVFACDIYTHKLAEFSLEKTPDTLLADAVRASMSIPLFFNAWQLSNNKPNNHLYVDGGMIYNYPITTFDTKGFVNWKTLGLRLDDIHKKRAVNEFGYGHWIDYIKNTFETLMTSQDIFFIHDADDVKRSIVVDDLGVKATDFDITEDTKNKLVESGRACTEAFLNDKV